MRTAYVGLRGSGDVARTAGVRGMGGVLRPEQSLADDEDLTNIAEIEDGLEASPGCLRPYLAAW